MEDKRVPIKRKEPKGLRIEERNWLNVSLAFMVAVEATGLSKPKSGARGCNPMLTERRFV
jgi:hypothetical protein